MRSSILIIIVIIASSIGVWAQHWSDPVLVDSINGVIMDFNPSLSADGQTMYFTTGNRIMVTHRNGDTWGAPTMLGPNINSGQRQVKATVTPDNRTLYFTSWRAGGYGTYDIWKSNWDDSNGCWGVPEVLPAPINTSYMEWDVQLSLDGMYMYFSSDRNFGYGYNDIWCTEWDTLAETWGEPYNLGDVINTSSIDECPYPSPDNNRLYFSSLVSHGFDEWQGGTDIFIAYKRAGAWDSLSILPPPINTLHNENSSALAGDETTLYIASTRLGGSGFDDIFISHLGTGIDEHEGRGDTQQFDFFLYPNPAKEYVLFSYKSFDSVQPLFFTIYNALGQQVHIVKSEGGDGLYWVMNTNSGGTPANGVYFAVGQIGKQIITKKFTIIK